MKKTLNFRYLLVLTSIVAVIGVTLYVLHGRQAKKQAEAFLHLAEDAQKKGELNRAVDYYLRYLVLRPDDTNARAQLGFAMARIARRPDEKLQAFLVFEQVLREDSKREDVRRRNARLAMEPSLHLYSEALNHLEALQAAHPADGDLCDLIGQCRAAMGEFAKADESWIEAIRLNPKLLSSYGRRAGLLRRRLNNPETADEVIGAMIDANVPSAQAHLIAATYWREFRSLEKAEQAMARAIELAPHDGEVLLTASQFALARAEALRQNAQAEKSAQETKKARDLLRLGIDKNPPPEAAPGLADGAEDEIAVKRALVAELYRSLIALEVRTAARLPEAENLARRGIEQLPDEIELELSLTDILIRREKIDEASEQITHLRNVGYSPAVLDFHRARILVLQSHWLDASHVLERATPELVLNPAVVRQAQLLLGECYDQMGEIDLRYEAFARSRPNDPLDPLWPIASVALAAAQAQMGRTKEAIETYRSVARLYKDAVSAAVPLARLLLLETVRKPRDKWDWREVEEVLRMLPDNLESALLRVEVRQARDQTSEARQLLEGARAKYAGEIALAVAFAFQAYVEKDETKAEACLKDAENHFGDRVEIRLARSRFLPTPLTPENSRRLASLAENINRFSPADRRKLLRGIADRAAALGASELTGRLWERLAVEQPDNLGAHYRRFDHAIEANDEPAILGVCADVRRIDGNDGTSTRMTRALYLIWKARRGDPRGLEEAYAHLLELQRKRPGWPRVLVNLAFVHELKGEVDSAIPKYREAVDLGEREPEVINRLVELYYQRQDFNEAETILRTAPEALASKEGSPFIAAEISVGTGDYARALEMAQKAVAADNKDYRKQLLLGRVMWMSGRRSEAEGPFRKAVDLEGSLPETWINLIQYYAFMKEGEKAKGAFAEARKRIKPEEASLTLAVGNEIMGHVDEARDLYEKALGERPRHIPTLRNAANFRLRQAKTDKGDLGAAEALLLEILKMQAKSREDADFARRQLAIILALSPDYERSRRALEIMGLLDQALSNPATSVDELRARAVVLSLQGGRRLRQEAAKIFEEIERRRPLSPDDQFLLAQIDNMLGEREKARARLARLVDVKGDNPQYVAYYARFLILNYEANAEARVWLAEARKWLTVLEKMHPDALRTVELRARLLVAENKKKEAVDGLLDSVKKRKDMALPGAIILEFLNEFNHAEAVYRQAADGSKQAGSRLALAGFYGRQNRNREALAILEQDADSIPPRSLSAAALGVLSQLEQPRPEDIRRVRILLEQRIPRESERKMEEAALLNLEGKYAEAAEAYRHVLERDPKNLVAMNNLAFLLAFDQRNTPEALEWIRRAKALTKPLRSLLDTEAAIKIRAGDASAAIDLLLDANADEPSATAYFHLAQAHYAVGNKGNAAHALSQAKKMGLRRSNLHPLEFDSYRQLLKEYP